MNRLFLTAVSLFAISAVYAQDVTVPGPRLVVYKTRKDYSNMVPVTLSDDKSKIITYPAPIDVKVADGYLKPSKLKKGYLLDNQGINANVAFLDISYEAYAKLSDAPSRDELYAKILDKDPLVEIYDCGERRGTLSELVKTLKKNIKKKRISNCNKIK